MNEQYNDCMICLESIKNAHPKMLSCNCRLLIHDDCHKKWNEQHKSECPICRKICHTLTIKIPVYQNNQERWYKKINNHISTIIIGIIIVLVIAVAVIL